MSNCCMECQAFDYKECMFQITPMKVISVIIIAVIVFALYYLIYKPYIGRKG